MNRHIFCLLITILFLSCSKPEKKPEKEIKTTLIESEIYSRYVSLHRIDQVLSIFYADEASLSIKNASLLDQVWKIRYLDKVDTEERINPVMGKHFINHDPEFTIYYLDYQAEEKPILKTLKKNPKSGEYLIDTVKIKCSDFFLLKGKEPLLLYKDMGLMLTDLNEQEVVFDSALFTDVKEFQMFRTLDYYTIVYSDTSGGLFLVRLQWNRNNNSFVTESVLQIDNTVVQFHAVSYDNDVSILYYTKDYLASYFRSGVTSKIGYYPAISTLHMNYIKTKPFFFLSVPDGENYSQMVYSLFLIRQDGKKNQWHEEKLTQAEVPFIAMDSMIDGDDFCLLLSSNTLQFLKIPMESL